MAGFPRALSIITSAPKEEIFEAACNKIGSDNEAYYRVIRDNRSMNGRQKLDSMIRSAYTNPTNEAVLAMVHGMISDPHFFKNQINDIYEVVAPQFIQPIIEQAVYGVVFGWFADSTGAILLVAALASTILSLASKKTIGRLV